MATDAPADVAPVGSDAADADAAAQPGDSGADLAAITEHYCEQATAAGCGAGSTVAVCVTLLMHEQQAAPHCPCLFGRYLSCRIDSQLCIPDGGTDACGGADYLLEQCAYGALADCQ